LSSGACGRVCIAILVILEGNSLSIKRFGKYRNLFKKRFLAAGGIYSKYWDFIPDKRNISL